jgi:hypothetical protein
MVIVAEVSKVLTLICRSCGCRRSEKARDLIFSLSLRRAYRNAGDTHVNPETHPSSMGEGEGIHFRHGHRERKASLSDGVAVDRIAAVDKQEEFREVTEELNKEIQEHRHEANA